MSTRMREKANYQVLHSSGNRARKKELRKKKSEKNT